MNIYDSFFRGITPEDWEFFAVDCLCSIGYGLIEPPARGSDGGKDAIVSYGNEKYIVSAKHYFNSNKAVGVDDENSMLERVIQHSTQGFIGFYSTIASQSLRDRFNKLNQKSGYKFIIFDKNQISNFIPQLNCFIIQKYGLPLPQNFSNPNISEYIPLPCVICGKDILSNGMPQLSLAGMALNNDGTYGYVFGCKDHVGSYIDVPWIDGLQSLHLEEMFAWGNVVEQFSIDHPIDSNYWKNFSLHQSRVLQVQYPSNYGVYPTTLLY